MEKVLNMVNIIDNTQRIILSPELAIEIKPGTGFLVSDSFFPERMPRVAFINRNTNISSFPLPNSLISATGYTTEAKTYQEEAKKLASSFSGKYGIFSASASYEQAKKNIDESTILYYTIEVRGDGLTLNNESIVWSQPPSAESIQKEDKRLRQFLEDYGSHYVFQLLYGQKITIRASYKSHEKKYSDKLKASLNAVSLFWKAGVSLNSEHTNFLKSSNCSIDASIIAGEISPASSMYISGFEQVYSFLSDLRNDKITITSGPIEAELRSYRHTLVQYPKCYELFENIPSPNPIDPKWGVPKGTIIAWIPDEDSLHRDHSTGEVLEIIPPTGWSLCNDFNGYFLRGVSSYNDLNNSNDEISHNHHLNILSEYGPGGKKSKAVEGADNYTGDPNWIHRHTVEGFTEIKEHLPPFKSVLYIRKE